MITLLRLVNLQEKSSLYNRVKAISDIKFCIPTQIAKCGNLIKQAKEDYLGNMLLKVLAKLGGCDHVALPSPTGGVSLRRDRIEHTLSWLLSWPCMIIGADVNHEHAGKGVGTSVSALVGSLGAGEHQFGAVIRQQEKGELIKNFDHECTKLLNEFQRRDGRYPREIIYIRDGISESQFQQVLGNEVAMFKNALRSLNVDCKLAVITAQKRHHTRLYYRVEQQQHQAEDVRLSLCVACEPVDCMMSATHSYVGVAVHEPMSRACCK